MQSQINMDRRFLFGGGALLILLGVVIASLLSNNQGARNEGKSLQEPVAQNSGDHPRSSQGKLPWAKADALNSEAGFFSSFEPGAQKGYQWSVSVVTPLERTQVALLSLENVVKGDYCTFELVNVTSNEVQKNSVVVFATGYDENLRPVSFSSQPFYWTAVRNLQGPDAFDGYIPEEAGLGVELKGEVYLYHGTDHGDNYGCQ